MRDHRAGVLQQAQVGELQTAPMPARKGKGYSRGTEAFPDDLTISPLCNERAARSPG